MSTGAKLTFVFYLMVLTIPGCYAVYQLTLSRLKMFLSFETLKKQQSVVLEIFEKQNDATIIIREPKDHADEESGKSSEQEVLYTNRAF